MSIHHKIAFNFHPIAQGKGTKLVDAFQRRSIFCFRTTPTSAGCYQARPNTLAATLPGTKIDLKYRCPGVHSSSMRLGIWGISGRLALFWGSKGFIVVPIMVFQPKCRVKNGNLSVGGMRPHLIPVSKTKTDIPGTTFVIPMPILHAETRPQISQDHSKSLKACHTKTYQDLACPGFQHLEVSINGGYPKMDGLEWKILLKWMLTGGTSIAGNLHFKTLPIPRLLQPLTRSASELLRSALQLPRGGPASRARNAKATLPKPRFRIW